MNTEMQESDYMGNGADYETLSPPAIPKNTREKPPVDYSHMIAVITTWKDILNARLLALLALVGSLAGFAFTMYDPSPLRLTGMAIYAILCQAPILAMYIRKG